MIICVGIADLRLKKGLISSFLGASKLLILYFSWSIPFSNLAIKYGHIISLLGNIEF